MRFRKYKTQKSRRWIEKKNTENKTAFNVIVQELRWSCKCFMTSEIFSLQQLKLKKIIDQEMWAFDEVGGFLFELVRAKLFRLLLNIWIKKSL